MRKKPANPYSPCVEGNAHKIIDFPKMVGFFFRAAIVAFPPIVTPTLLPIQDMASMIAIPTYATMNGKFVASIMICFLY